LASINPPHTQLPVTGMSQQQKEKLSVCPHHLHLVFAWGSGCHQWDECGLDSVTSWHWL